LGLVDPCSRRSWCPATSASSSAQTHHPAQAEILRTAMEKCYPWHNCPSPVSCRCARPPHTSHPP
jgi:hypothetical protein